MKRRIKVLVVDDQAVFRKVVADLLAEDSALEVVGTAHDGEDALSKYRELKPDVVILDVEMPKMSGLDALREIRRGDPRTAVIMFGSQTERGAAVTLHALTAGASDYLCKPSNSGDFHKSREFLKQELIPKVKAFPPLQSIAEDEAAPVPRFRAPLEREAASVSRPRTTLATSSVTASTAPVEVVVVGVSTGGPDALLNLFSQFQGERLPVPILIVQHMPATFTTVFAQRLSETSKLDVIEAKEGDIIGPGKIWLAPGDFHMKVVKEGLYYTLRLNQDPPENFCRPAVDPLFRSVAEVYGASALAVVLTGMGQDGMLGAVALKGQGAAVVVQDEATSVVWGMPGAVVRAGAADAVISLPEMAAEITRRVKAGR